jgi:hypothetical protein
MYEGLMGKIAVFGGNSSQPIQYKGTSPYTILRRDWMLTFAFTGAAGNQALEWAELDTEIKTAGLKDVREV